MSDFKQKTFEQWYKEQYDPNGYLYPSAPLNIGFQDYCVRVNEYLQHLASIVNTGEKQCNLPVVTAPLLWKDVLDDFYVEHDRQISNGEYKGKMILVFRDWLEKNYQVPERNGR